jgi:hypothetical protein
MSQLYQAIDRLEDALTGPREYQVIVEDDANLLEEQLNAASKDGWRVTHFLGDRVLMERPVPRKENG